jgi:hypothetical protein
MQIIKTKKGYMYSFIKHSKGYTGTATTHAKAITKGLNHFKAII